MFLVFNKEKIYTYIVSVFTILLIFVFANYVGLKSSETIETLASNERLIPIYNVQTEEKNVSLTMNCAWNADDIDEILKVLKNNKVKITFFVVGEWVDKYPDAVKKIYEAEQEIRNT